MTARGVGLSVEIEILSGPDRGKRFSLVDDLAHFGRSDDNTIPLSDTAIAEFQATIARQGQQFELYTDLASTVTINGAIVPPQQWVPLQLHSRVYLGGVTEVRLCEADGESNSLSRESLVSEPVTAMEGTPAASRTPAPPVARRPPRKESKRQVARLIPQSKVAEPVTLGQDGKFPELALASSSAKPTAQRPPRESNPVLLFTVLAASFLSSAGLLLVDFEARPARTRSDAAVARSQLVIFYGKDSQGQEQYQKLLRQASVEHSQGHLREEQVLLKRVLSLLNAVDTAAPDNLNGLTGRQTGRGKASDKELRELIELILQ
ncbi:MAG: FHA domain-containing protein [Planctomycetota bacterium]|nr:MAG: FHA domain-containing protein [Planctomycetota bacterium]